MIHKVVTKKILHTTFIPFRAFFMPKKDILTDIPLHKKARDGAIGPGDQWLAPTEEDFRSSETSN